MNINNNINKLLKALQVKGQLYRINTFQFYNERNDKYVTKYQISKRKFVEEYDEELCENVIKEKYELWLNNVKDENLLNELKKI